MFKWYHDWKEWRKRKRQAKVFASLPKLKHKLDLDKHKVKFYEFKHGCPWNYLGFTLSNVNKHIGDETFTGIIFTLEHNHIYTIYYFKNGVAHREDGPAKIHFTTGTDNRLYDTIFEWIIDGKRHRIGKPAISRYIGNVKNLQDDTYVMWNNIYKPKEFNKWCKENGIKVDKITPEDEILIRMRWDKC